MRATRTSASTFAATFSRNCTIGNHLLSEGCPDDSLLYSPRAFNVTVSGFYFFVGNKKRAHLYIALQCRAKRQKESPRAFGAAPDGGKGKDGSSAPVERSERRGIRPPTGGQGGMADPTNDDPRGTGIDAQSLVQCLTLD